MQEVQKIEIERQFIYVYHSPGSITTYHHHQQNIYKHSDAKIRRIQTHHGPHTIITPDSHGML